MNDALQNFARNELKAGLANCTPEQLNVFKLMYARNGGRRSVEDAKAMPIGAVVNEIPDEKLSWAMDQVANTLRKNAAKA